jgi:uncharacterized protein
MLIGHEEGADLEILKIASLLHDVARAEAGGEHALQSASEAKRILSRFGLPQEKIHKVADAISAHRFRGKRRPLTLEAKILSDADKLDAMGAIGIYRASAFGAEVQRPLQRTLDHFDEKLLKLKDRMYTRTAKRLAKGRHKFMLAYLKQIRKEMKFES